MKSLIERDQKVVWHPYTQHGRGTLPIAIKSAQGATLNLEDGSTLLDAISSWWVNIHGHSHPKIASAIAEQAGRLEHAIFAGFTHEPAVKLAEILIGATSQSGANLSRVFYSDNGSTAVEVALKMAYQYHQLQGVTGAGARSRFLALNHSYHGDTFGAMAVSEPTSFHERFQPLLTTVDFVEPGDLAQLEMTISQSPEAYCAMIIEPLVQGAAGMKMYSASYLREVARLCSEYKILLICDEVFTGFYRTGKLFAFEHAGIQPDLICLSKGLTGGFMPLSATLATEQIFEAFLSSDISRAFLHGHSYTANPLACAAAIASWELLQSPSCLKRIGEITSITEKRITQINLKLRAHGLPPSGRFLGTIGAIELPLGSAKSQAYGSELGERIKLFTKKRGVLLRPLGNVLYSLPPYCITNDELEAIYTVIDDVFEQFLIISGT